MLSLVDSLATFSPEQLDDLADFWGISPPESTEEEDLRTFAAGLAEDWSARTALGRLNPTEALLLGRVLSATNRALEPARLQADLGLAAEPFEAAVSHLRRMALVQHSPERFVGNTFLEELRRRDPWLFRQAPTRRDEISEVLLPFRELRQPLRRAWNQYDASLREVQPGRPGDWRPSLMTLLHSTPTDLLEETAQLIRLPGFEPRHSRGRKEDFVQALHRGLLAPSVLQTLLITLPSIEQDAVARLRAAGRQMPIEELRRALGKREAELRPHWKRLAALFLVQDSFFQGQHVVFIPKEIETALDRPAEAPDRGAPELLQPAPPPTDVRPGRPLLPWAILTILSALGRERVHLTQDGDLPVRLLKRLAPELEPSVRPWPALPLLMLAQQLIRWAHLVDWEYSDRRLIPAWTRAIQTTGTSFARQSAFLLDRWIEQPLWQDPSPTQSEGSTAHWLNLSLLRRRLVDLLRGMVLGQWYSIPGLIEALRQRETYFARPQQELVRYFGYRALYEVPATWNQVEAPAIAAALITLHWLGAVDLGYGVTANGSAPPATVAVPEMGSWLAGPRDAPPPEPPEVDRPLVVQPNFDVVVLSPRLDILYTTARFSRPVHFDYAVHFHLDHESILGAADNGMTAQEILGHLSDYGRATVPQNVARSMEEWLQSIQPVYLSQGWILEVESGEVLDRILSDKSLAALVDRRLGPTAALIRTGRDPERVKDFLRRKGYAVGK